MDRKSEIRKKALEQRSKISFSKINQWSKKICDKFFSLSELNTAKKIMSFVTKSKEVNTFSLMERLLDEGYLLYVPFTRKDKIALGTAQINDLDHDLMQGVFDVLEPLNNIRDETPPEDLDIIIVPGLVFTRDGYRIGYGGGYYDSFLAEHGSDSLKVGFCYSQFLTDEIPIEEHDIPVDIIITEKEIIYT
jgi:5-formyltetrahydrofolate cyclo-ligase